jgi:hypothetical protein
MARPACVSKAWRKAHKDFLQAALAKEIPQFFQTALTHGWELCDLNEYTQFTVQTIPSSTSQKHFLKLGDDFVLSVKFTCCRFRVHSPKTPRFRAQLYTVNTFHAKPVENTVDIPAVCWLDPLCLTAEQVDEKLDWFQHHTTVLMLWLEQQRAAAQA